ncbi:MAG: alpha/beta fold hydrolase [Myxococcales bacterium]|nr:alpha/beta fold hydrolase [Myxococcales bacterium]
MRRLRGLKQLVHDAVDATTHLVKEGHDSTARAVLRVTDRIGPIAGAARDVDDVRRVSTDLVLASVRIVNRAVEVVTNAGIGLAERAGEGEAESETEPAVPMRSDAMNGAPGLTDAAIGLVNGVVGDQLHARKNTLDLGMELRVGDSYVPLEAGALAAALGNASPKAAVFVHGLGTTEWSWCLLADRYHGDPAVCFGTLLERDLGYTPLFIRYNTGKKISDNGRLLADLLDKLAQHYPTPLEELALFGHSMGGLVVRSACHHGSEAGHGWIRHVRRVFCLASPHRGAPLEKFGHLLTRALDAVDLPGTQIPARILEARSAGIQDLRHGTLVDDDWLGPDADATAAEGAREVPLLPHVRYHFFSATVTRDPAHPVGFLVGDLLVRVPSGSGPEVSESTFPIETACYGGVMHHELQNHPQVYQQIRACCAEPR